VYKRAEKNTNERILKRQVALCHGVDINKYFTESCKGKGVIPRELDVYMESELE
jgi:hypothetical protein